MMNLELSDKDKAIIQKVCRQIGAQHNDINYYLAYWSNFVNLVKDGYEGSIHSFTNSLDVRERISKIIELVPPQIANEIKEIVAHIDSVFLGHTVESKFPVPWREDYPDEAWVNRLPKSYGGEHDFQDYLSSRGLL